MTDTGTIFEHEDSDGDGFVLWEDGGGLDLQRFGSNPYCDMAPADVRRLHLALGQWLTKNGVPAEDVNPFVKPTPSVGGDDMLRKVVREEIEAYFDSKTDGDIPFDPSSLTNRSTPQNPIRFTPTVDNLMKMEVDDVTHGGDDCWGEACKLCGHVSGVHTGKAGCHVPDTSAPDGYCACTRITAQCALPKLPMRIRRRTCSECGEPWEKGHRTSCVGPLEVQEVQTSALHSGCTCKGHLHELHLDKYACNRTGCFCPNPKGVQS